MTNDTGVRNIKALCGQGKVRDATYLAREHRGNAQVLGREIGELVRQHKVYLALIERLDGRIAITDSSVIASSGTGGFRGTVQQQMASKDTQLASLRALFSQMETRLDEMHARLSVIAVGLNALRG